MDAPRGTRKLLFYTFLGMIADALDVILTSVIPDKTPEEHRCEQIFFRSPCWICLLVCSDSGVHVSPVVGRRPP